MIPARRTWQHAITATGTVQGDAYQLTTELAVISTGAANTGVLLSDASQMGGGVHFIANISGSDKKVYPQSGEGINGLAADTPITLADDTGLVCICTGFSAWYCWTGSLPLS